MKHNGGYTGGASSKSHTCNPHYSGGSGDSSKFHTNFDLAKNEGGSRDAKVCSNARSNKNQGTQGCDSQTNLSKDAQGGCRRFFSFLDLLDIFFKFLALTNDIFALFANTVECAIKIG